ncbi:DUF6951 family protein [Methanolobus psychrotolerans]|uniref:DUF6951 family protein n=1 Tax=Methanolobus psychrotolerans TaxID=1874706 RepID=UPI000B9155D7|nr:hypothetical protein [Methanolobus psychrotolerans]
MTGITINSRRCGYVHEVSGKIDGNKVIIEIDTLCNVVKNISRMEVPLEGILGIKDNYVLEKASHAPCCDTCLVPCAVLHLCRLEAGYMSKSLVKDVGNISIEFKSISLTSLSFIRNKGN